MAQIILVGFFLALSLARIFGPAHWFRDAQAQEEFIQEYGSRARTFDLVIGLMLFLFGILIWFSP